MSYFENPTDPATAARFFCFMGYSHEKVVNFLTERLSVPEHDAHEMVERAAQHVREADSFLDSEVAKNEAAQAAEHDLTKTNDPKEDQQ